MFSGVFSFFVHSLCVKKNRTGSKENRASSNSLSGVNRDAQLHADFFALKRCETRAMGWELTPVIALSLPSSLSTLFSESKVTRRGSRDHMLARAIQADGGTPNARVNRYVSMSIFADVVSLHYICSSCLRHSYRG